MHYFTAARYNAEALAQVEKICRTSTKGCWAFFSNREVLLHEIIGLLIELICQFFTLGMTLLKLCVFLFDWKYLSGLLSWRCTTLYIHWVMPNWEVLYQLFFECHISRNSSISALTADTETLWSRVDPMFLVHVAARLLLSLKSCLDAS